MIHLTKEFAFESAHSLLGYDGKCREIHGHSYRFFVTVTGKPIEDLNNPKCGMIIDFGDLKKIVNEAVVDRMDHSFVIRRSEQSREIVSTLKGIYKNIIEVDYQPTCENFLEDFASRISAKLPDNVQLYSLKLYETATSYAEWFNENL